MTLTPESRQFSPTKARNGTWLECAGGRTYTDTSTLPVISVDDCPLYINQISQFFARELAAKSLFNVWLLIWTFAFWHTAPLGDVQKKSGNVWKQLMAETETQTNKHTHTNTAVDKCKDFQITPLPRRNIQWQRKMMKDPVLHHIARTEPLVWCL